MVVESMKTTTAVFNPEDGQSVVVWKEVDLLTIRDLNQVEEDTDLIDDVTGKRIWGTQKINIVMVNYVPDEKGRYGRRKAVNELSMYLKWCKWTDIGRLSF